MSLIRGASFCVFLVPIYDCPSIVIFLDEFLLKSVVVFGPPS